MMAATADDERTIGLGERIGTMTLVRGGLARLRAHAPAALVLWLAISTMSAGVELAARATGLQTDAPAVSGAYLGYLFATAFVSSLGSLLAARLFLQGRAGLLRVDRGLIEALGLLAGMTALVSWSASLYAVAMAGSAQSPQNALAMGVGGAVAYLAMAYVLLKVTLWPIGRLMGRPEVTPGRSWRLMRKATRGVILAYVLAIVPLMVVSGVLGGMGMLDPGAASIVPVVAVQAAAVGYLVMAYAIVATLWTLRVEKPATVADVFG